jgi:uncharacterized protein
VDYLITGASGFIGRRLVGRLLALGHEVNYLGRKRSGTLDSRAAFHLWNPDEPPPLNSISRLDAIIHLAGEPVAQRWNDEVKQRIYSSRTEGTRKLVSAISELKHKPSVLVSASAVGYYGNRGDEILTEESTAGDDFLAKVCIDWEREASRAREFGLRVVIIRVSLALGREGGALKSMLTPFRLGLGGRFGSGRQWVPWIHVDDLVRLFVYSAENSNVSGPLNGTGPQPVRNSEFVQALGRALHRPAILPVPNFVLKLILGEVADSVVNSLRVIPQATERAGFQFTYPELEGALNSLLE